MYGFCRCFRRRPIFANASAFFAARGAQAAGWPCRRRCEGHRLSNSSLGVHLADSKAAFLTKYPAHLPKRHRCPCHAEALTPQYPGRARHVERGADASCSWPRSSNTFSACRRPPGATRSSQFLHRLELLKAVEPKKRHAGERDLAVCEGAQDTLAHVTWLSVTSPFPWTCVPSRNQFSHRLESEAFSAAKASARRLKWPSTGQCKKANRPSPTPCESPICIGRRARPPIGWAKPPAAASRRPEGPER